MKRFMLLPLAAMTAHIQANPVSSNVVVTTTTQLVSANKNQEHLTFNASWRADADARGMIVARFAPSQNTIDEEALSLVLTANGTAQLLPSGAPLSTNLLHNLDASAASGYSVSYKVFASANKTRVEGNAREIWENTPLDYNDFTPFTFTEVLILGHGLALSSPVNVRFSPTFSLFLVK